MARPPKIRKPEPVLTDSIQLRDGETLDAFLGALMAAVEKRFEMPTAPGGYWWFAAVGDGWLVACLRDGSETEHYRTSWVRASDGSFSFGDFREVRQVVSYVPVDPEGSADTTTGGTIATVASRGNGKKRSPLVQRPAMDALSDRAPEVFLDRLEVSKIQKLSDADAARYPKASPTGKAFLSVYRAGGTIVGRINHNDYLYQDVEVDGNVARLSRAIEDAYAHKIDDGPNFAVADLIGAADHPGMFSGESIKDSCTMLLGIERIGDDVEIVFGIMDTTVGRDQQTLIDYGMPVATSMRSKGIRDARIMGADDPYFDRNQEYDGREYYRITDLHIVAFDLVVRPASDTYVQQRLDSLPIDVRTSLTDAYQRLRDAAAPKQQEQEMTKEALSAALRDMTVADFRALAPDLAAALLKDAEPPKSDPAAVAPVETPAVDAEPTESAAASSAEVPLEPPAVEPAAETSPVIVQGDAAEEKRLRIENAALRAQLDAAVAEKKAADDQKAETERRAAIEDGITKLCAGLQWREGRQVFLREHVLEDRTKTVADLEAFNAEFDRTFPALLDKVGAAAPGLAKTAQEVPGEPAPVSVQPSSDPLGGIGFSL